MQLKGKKLPYKKFFTCGVIDGLFGGFDGFYDGFVVGGAHGVHKWYQISNWSWSLYYIGTSDGY